MHRTPGYSDYKAALIFYDVARGYARIENDDPGHTNSRVVWPGGTREEIGALTEASFYDALRLLGAPLPMGYPVAIQPGLIRSRGPRGDDSAYVSPTPCPHGHVGAKIGHGHCLICLQQETERGGLHEQINALMNGAPEMELSRAMASRYGVPVYRSGRPCPHGHTGWRYVSTASCVECLRNRSRATRHPVDAISPPPTYWPLGSAQPEGRHARHH